MKIILLWIPISLAFCFISIDRIVAQEYSRYAFIEELVLPSDKIINVKIYQRNLFGAHLEEPFKFMTGYKIDQKGRVIESLGFNKLCQSKKSHENKDAVLLRKVLTYNKFNNILTEKIYPTKKPIKYSSKCRKRKKFKKEIANIQWKDAVVESIYKYDKQGHVIKINRTNTCPNNEVNIYYPNIIYKNEYQNGKLLRRFQDDQTVAVDSFAYQNEYVFHYGTRLKKHFNGKSQRVLDFMKRKYSIDKIRDRFMTRQTTKGLYLVDVIYNEKGLPIAQASQENNEYEVKYFYDDNDRLVKEIRLSRGVPMQELIYEYTYE